MAPDAKLVVGHTDVECPTGKSKFRQYIGGKWEIMKSSFLCMYAHVCVCGVW